MGRVGRGSVWSTAVAAGVVEQLPRPGAQHRSEAEPWTARAEGSAHTLKSTIQKTISGS
jgi:hypothetical protein